MPISHKHKTIFVHIPKTAGSSVEKFLSIGGNSPKQLRSHKIFKVGGVTYAGQHFTSSILQQHKDVKKYWDSYFRFSIVRHPYTRVLSEYFWYRGKTKTNLSFVLSHFNEWLHTFYEKMDRDHKLSQTIYLYEVGKLQVDKVFKFENLPYAIKILKRKCNVEGKFYHIQKSSNKKGYLQKLTSKQKDFIYELYEDDFKNFNYER